MRTRIIDLIATLKKHIDGGLFHIFGSSVIAEIASLVSSIVVVRHLPKLEYGQYVNANNLYSYITVFIGLGLTSAVLQFCSENIHQDEKNAIYHFSLKNGSIFNILLAFVICLLSGWKYYSGEREVAFYLLLMIGLPFTTYIFSIIQTIQLVRRKNQAYSAVNIISTVSRLIGNILFTYLWGVSGLITSTYLCNIISALVGVILLKKDISLRDFITTTGKITQAKRKNIISYAGMCSITNFTSNILSLLDVTCLGIVLADDTILADYHVASVIPSACLFVPACLITYYYPQMVEGFANDRIKAKKEIWKYVKIFIVTSLIITVGVLLLGPVAIKILYGEKYLTCVTVLRILTINFFVSGGIRKVLGNSIAVIKKVKVNLIHTVICSCLNIVLNMTMIPKWGSNGAAIATLISNSIVALLEIIYIYHYCKRAST